MIQNLLLMRLGVALHLFLPLLNFLSSEHLAGHEICLAECEEFSTGANLEVTFLFVQIKFLVDIVILLLLRL